jgi:hypothetical protein
MTTKTNPPARPAGSFAAGPWDSPPWTTVERLQCIAAMGQRIHGYVEFMCAVGNLNGTSDEAKEKAVTAFYELLAVLEGQLGRIQEDLRLG